MIVILLDQGPTDTAMKQLAVASHALQRSRGGGKGSGGEVGDELAQLRKLMEPEG
jgi:hypothetical protein